MSDTDWQPIKPNDIRTGDRIRRLYHGAEVIGVAAIKEERASYRFAWVTSGGYLVAASTDVALFLDPDSRIPEIPVGTTGTATVRGVEGVRVMRTQNTTNPWVTPISMGVSYSYWHPGEVVTDFQPDNEPLAEWEHDLLREEEIRAEERERIISKVSAGADDILFQEARQAFLRWLRDGAR